MTVNDLLDYLKLIAEEDDKGHQEVRVKVSERSFPATPSVKIIKATSGFDWDSGQFILYPETPLVRKEKK